MQCAHYVKRCTSNIDDSCSRGTTSYKCSTTPIYHRIGPLICGECICDGVPLISNLLCTATINASLTPTAPTLPNNKTLLTPTIPTGEKSQGTSSSEQSFTIGILCVAPLLLILSAMIFFTAKRRRNDNKSLTNPSESLDRLSDYGELRHTRLEDYILPKLSVSRLSGFSLTASSTSTSSSLYTYQVLSPHVPRWQDELELSVGDVVVVTEIYEDGYCLGSKGGASGIFPLNCTRVTSEEQDDQDLGTILRLKALQSTERSHSWHEIPSTH